METPHFSSISSYPERPDTGNQVCHFSVGKFNSVDCWGCLSLIFSPQNCVFFLADIAATIAQSSWTTWFDLGCLFFFLDPQKSFIFFEVKWTSVGILRLFWHPHTHRVIFERWTRFAFQLVSYPSSTSEHVAGDMRPSDYRVIELISNSQKSQQPSLVARRVTTMALSLADGRVPSDRSHESSEWSLWGI